MHALCPCRWTTCRSTSRRASRRCRRQSHAPRSHALAHHRLPRSIPPRNFAPSAHAVHPPDARTTPSVALARFGARLTLARRASAPTARARRSARRPAVFAASPALQQLRPHYARAQDAGRGGAAEDAALAHYIAPARGPDLRPRVVGPVYLTRVAWGLCSKRWSSCVVTLRVL